MSIRNRIYYYEYNNIQYMNMPLVRDQIYYMISVAVSQMLKHSSIMQEKKVWVLLTSDPSRNRSTAKHSETGVKNILRDDLKTCVRTLIDNGDVSMWVKHFPGGNLKQTNITSFLCITQCKCLICNLPWCIHFSCPYSSFLIKFTNL